MFPIEKQTMGVSAMTVAPFSPLAAMRALSALLDHSVEDLLDAYAFRPVQLESTADGALVRFVRPGMRAADPDWAIVIETQQSGNAEIRLHEGDPSVARLSVTIRLAIDEPVSSTSPDFNDRIFSRALGLAVSLPGFAPPGSR
jgi:hypothetical protein